MKITKNKLFKNLFQQGVTVTRTEDHVISVKKEGEIPVEILLPENFELEKKALEQLLGFAYFATPSGSKVKCACATPDFHTGSSIPVGSVVVTPSNMVVPSAIGTDINCGMRLHKTGLSLPTFLSIKKELLALLKGDLLEGTRDVPTTGIAMQALFSNGLGDFWTEMLKTRKGIFEKVDKDLVLNELNHLHESAFLKGNAVYAPPALTQREWMRDPSFATLGGGNHFCEFQVVSDIVDRKKAYEAGLKVGDVVYMIHTGSRDVGFYVGNRWMDIAKQSYPKSIKHPSSKIYALELDNVEEYLQAMQSASHYATANRALIAELVRQRIAGLTPLADNELVTDVPHNIILKGLCAF